MIFGDNKRRDYPYNIGKTVLAHFYASVVIVFFVWVLVATMY